MTENLSGAGDEDAAGLQVEHQPEGHRFVARLDGKTGVLEYLRVGDSLILSHTEVQRELEGRGVGAALAQAALGYVRDQGLTATPLCPFVRAYIQRHPEYKELVGFGQRGERLD